MAARAWAAPAAAAPQPRAVDAVVHQTERKKEKKTSERPIQQQQQLSGCNLSVKILWEKKLRGRLRRCSILVGHQCFLFFSCVWSQRNESLQFFFLVATTSSAFVLVSASFRGNQRPWVGCLLRCADWGSRPSPACSRAFSPLCLCARPVANAQCCLLAAAAAIA